MIFVYFEKFLKHSCTRVFETSAKTGNQSIHCLYLVVVG